MPIFEFRCEACENGFEVLVRGQSVPVCPRCGSEELKRQISVPAAHVRGGSLAVCESPRPAPPSGGFCGRGLCGMPGCGDG